MSPTGTGHFENDRIYISPDEQEIIMRLRNFKHWQKMGDKKLLFGQLGEINNVKVLIRPYEDDSF